MQVSEIIAHLLEKRGINTPEGISEFLNPRHPSEFSLAEVGLSKRHISQAVQLVKFHIASGDKIAIYGDYDVDGITSTAILWETLYHVSPHVFPHIPHRRIEGYGLTKKGIDHCLSQGAKLIITVDNGITAREEIAYCRSNGCDTIIVDHHSPPDQLPNANCIVHSTSTSAAGLSWIFAREFNKAPNNELLSLVAISVVCDLVPLLGLNRSFAKYGLEELNRTHRPGLLALFQLAGITGKPIGAYEIGFVIGPRLNATGRLEHAIDSLRLLCTTDSERALDLASHLDATNRIRQDLTLRLSESAISQFSSGVLPPILVTANPDYDEGIVGLIAARLVEKYYRPSIAINLGEVLAKGSARSIPGIHITELLRTASSLLKSVGGHEMAAGLSFAPENLSAVTDKLISECTKLITPDLFVRQRQVDADIPLSASSLDLQKQLSVFAPFGLGNPRPVFSSVARLTYPRRIGKDNRHLKFYADNLEAIYFNAPFDMVFPDFPAKIYYSLDANTFSGIPKLQLIIKEVAIPG